MQKSGVNRVKVLAKSDAVTQQLLEAGVPQTLTNILEDSDDPGEIFSLCEVCTTERAWSGRTLMTY